MERLPERNWPVGERLAGHQVVEGSLRHHFPAVDARTRAHLHDMIGGANGVFVVLHHDHGVADVAQAFERGDHLHVVLGMQADAGLIEHVEHAHQTRSDLRGEADALRFAARKRAGTAVEIQVVEADAEQQRSRRPRISPSTCRPASAPRPDGLRLPRNACSSSK